MFQVARWRVILVVLVTLIGVVFASPNVIPEDTRANLPGWVPTRSLNLGLDLRGGSYLELEADRESFRDEALANLGDTVSQNLTSENIQTLGVQAAGDDITVTLQDPALLDRAYSVLNPLAQPDPMTGASNVSISRQSDNQIVVSIRPDGWDAMVSDAVSASLDVIRRRVDPDGVREISVTKQGVDRIVLQAPGESDPERLERLVETSARMTFQMVDSSANVAEAVATGILPPGAELVPQPSRPDEPNLVLRRRIDVSGDMLNEATFSFNEAGQAVVNLRFNNEGAQRFGEVTAANVNQRFAVVLDGNIITAPNINEPILGGRAVISGSFTPDTATELAQMLSAGALQIDFEVLQRRSVSAQLGADAVAAGQTATLIALVAVLIFMVLAYGVLFGGISVVALVINGILIIAAMSGFGAALTLPGIAGLILTLAMAVDANVLIYERMRDEIRAGKNTISAMESGFSRAMVTIVDANLTTLIAAFIMFVFGEGPVKGFAWTLSIGIFTSVFTAVFITQVVLAFWFRARRPKTLPIAG